VGRGWLGAAILANRSFHPGSAFCGGPRRCLHIALRLSAATMNDGRPHSWPLTLVGIRVAVQPSFP